MGKRSRNFNTRTTWLNPGRENDHRKIMADHGDDGTASALGKTMPHLGKRCSIVHAYSRSTQLVCTWAHTSGKAPAEAHGFRDYLRIVHDFTDMHS